MRARAGRTLGQVAFVAAILLVWQWLVDQGHLDGTFFGSPRGVAESLEGWWSSGDLVRDVASSLRILALGYVLGLLAGVALGALIGLSDFTRRVLDPFITFVNAMPRILIYPFLSVWLGYGSAPKVLLVIFTISFLIAIVLAGAFADIDDELTASLKVYGAGRWDFFRQLYAPALSIKVLSTMRLALGYAFPAVIIAEYVGATEGIGYFVVISQGRFDVQGILAGVAVVVTLAVLLTGIIGVIERRASRWMPT